MMLGGCNPYLPVVNSLNYEQKVISPVKDKLTDEGKVDSTLPYDSEEIEVPLSRKVKDCYALTDHQGTTLLKLKALLAGKNPLERQTGESRLYYSLNDIPRSQLDRMCEQLTYRGGERRVINLPNIYDYWENSCQGGKDKSCVYFFPKSGFLKKE